MQLRLWCSHHYKSYIYMYYSSINCIDHVVQNDKTWQNGCSALPVLTTALGANLGSQSATVMKAMAVWWNSDGAWRPLRCWDLDYVLCPGRRDLKTSGCNLGIEIQNSCGTAIFNCASNHGSCQACQTLSHLVFCFRRESVWHLSCGQAGSGGWFSSVLLRRVDMYLGETLALKLVPFSHYEIIGDRNEKKAGLYLQANHTIPHL